MIRRETQREHPGHPVSGPTGPPVVSPRRSRTVRTPGREEAQRQDPPVTPRILQLKNVHMDGNAQQGDEQRERFPARYRSGYLPLLREGDPPQGEHPLLRAGRLLDRLQPGPEPGPAEAAPAPDLQERLDELTRRLRQVQRSLQPDTPRPDEPLLPAPDSTWPEGLHNRLLGFLEEWSLWQDGRGERDPRQELAEFCHSDYMDKLLRLHPLAFLVLDDRGRVLYVSPTCARLEELAGLQGGDLLEDHRELHLEPGTGVTWLQVRHKGLQPLHVRDWPLPGGRLLCFPPGQ